MKKLDLDKVRNAKRKQTTEGTLELKLPGQAEAIKAVEQSIENLHDLIEGKKEYDFDQIKTELTNIKGSIDSGLNIAPLNESLDKFITKYTSTQNSVTKQNKEDLSELLKSLEDSIIANKPIVNVKFNDIRVEYGAADYKIIDGTAYVGYVHPSGKWYILRQTGTTEGTFRYATGTKDYNKAWSLKSSQRYYSYDEVRL